MNVPNLLSLLRLLLVPVFAAVFFSGHPQAGYIAAAVFLFAFLTDIADGYIARRFNQITKLGRILDPLADKLMKAAAVICLTIRGDIPLWVILILLTKELVMMLGGTYLLRRTKDVPSSNWVGKIAEGSVVVLVLLLITFRIPRGIAVALWCAVLALELVALGFYVAYALKYLREQEKGN